MASGLTTVGKIKTPNQPTPPKMQGGGFVSQQPKNVFTPSVNQQYEYSQGFNKRQNRTVNTALTQIANKRGMNDLSNVHQGWNKKLNNQLIANGVSPENAKMMSNQFKKNALTKQQAEYKNGLMRGEKMAPVTRKPVTKQNIPVNRGIVTSQQWNDRQKAVAQAVAPSSFQRGRALYQLGKSTFGKSLGIGKSRYGFNISNIDPNSGTYVTRVDQKTGQEERFLYDPKKRTLSRYVNGIYQPLEEGK